MKTGDPLFMAGAVAVGMFHRPELAGAIMASHYLAALGTGLLMRFYRAGEGGIAPRPTSRLMGHRPLLQRALWELWEARRKDGRPLGQLLGDAVRDSISTLMLVGGMIIIAAVVIDVLLRLGVVGWLSAALDVPLRPLGLGRRAAATLVSGLFEITIGVKAASELAVPLLQRLVLVNAIIAWSGLSVFAQVAAVTRGLGISLRPYVVARAVQAVLASLLTFCFWNPAWAEARQALPVAAHPLVLGTAAWLTLPRPGWWAVAGRAILELDALLLSGALVCTLLVLTPTCHLTWVRWRRVPGAGQR